jgi:tripartite-type tricarboxylate transporter receptor subunit TctC
LLLRKIDQQIEEEFTMRGFKLTALVFAALVPTLAAASALSYPDRPITIIVPFAAGGLTDVPVRLFAKILQDDLHVPIVVENKPGGSGVIGATYVLRAQPDGYTLLANAIADTQNLFYMNVPYSAEKDFVDIGKIVDGPPLVLVVNSKLPYKSLEELLADAKAHPDKINFGTSGFATSPFIALSELNDAAGMHIPAVPYHGSGEAAAAVVTGAVQATFTFYSAAKPLVDGGQVRPLAVAGPKRVTSWPNVPTMQDSGLKGYDFNGFVGLAAPAQTPREIVKVLNQALNRAIHTDLFKTRMEGFGMTIPDEADNTQEKFTAFFHEETDRQRKLSKSVLVKIKEFGAAKH